MKRPLVYKNVINLIAARVLTTEDITICMLLNLASLALKVIKDIH